MRIDSDLPRADCGGPEVSPTVTVISHGCRANQEEIECLLGALIDRGFRPVRFGERADWTVINTCSVTAAGEADARKAIRRAGRVSQGGRVAVTGCFAQRDPDLAARLGADLVIGNGEKHRIPDLLASAVAGQEACTGILYGEDPTTRRFLRHSRESSRFRTRAALKIQDGCDEHCTYCIIPKLRGRSVSRPVEEVLAEARLLVDSGHPEITLTGIHSASYGADSGGPKLSGLLRRLLEVERLDRIRINSLEPNWVDAELLETIASSSRFCRHLHLPLQSGDALILKRMGRRYTPEEYLEAVALARGIVPQIAIGIDVMVGFPGETDRAFQNTVRLLEAARPAYLHLFRYSERPGVASTHLPDPVDERVKRTRIGALRDLDLQMRETFLRARVGEVHDLLVEGKRDGVGREQGLTDTFVRVAFETTHSPGQWERVCLDSVLDAKRMLGRVTTAPISRVDHEVAPR